MQALALYTRMKTIVRNSYALQAFTHAGCVLRTKFTLGLYMLQLYLKVQALALYVRMRTIVRHSYALQAFTHAECMLHTKFTHGFDPRH